MEPSDTLPPGYPSEWTANLLLRDGTTVLSRPIRPEDAAGLDDLVANRMSRQSVYQRFFRVKDKLDAEELEYFTVLDYAERMAFVVESEGVIVGVGRYDRQEQDSTLAEVAFAVADDDQGRGIGTRLLDYLTAYARDQGISSFRAFVLAENHAMLRVFRGAGFRMEREMEEGVYNVEFPTVESDETRAAHDEHEKRSTAASMMPIFYPHSVAVVGASRDPASIGGRLFANLLRGDFTGPVYPVNPGAPVVRSVKAYPSVLDVPGNVDLAFVVVPSSHVIKVAEECAAKGVKGLVVISAGFGETGDDGRAAEARLLEVVRDNSMRMIGPNCMGILNTDPAISLDGQFGPIFPGRGNVGMSSQSGALGIAILDYASRLNIGISTFVSVGNKADVSGNDLLLYWEDDAATDVIVLYLESFGNPRRFARIARRIAKRKPIVAVKSGRTAAGARAASSHTGSLASFDIAVDALFRQAGVIRTDTLAELFDVTSLLANQPRPAGRRVGIITNAGGPGILAVDALESEGLEVVGFSPHLQEALSEQLSSDAAVHNPVDMIASAGPDQYKACIDLVMTSGEVDTLLVIYIPTAITGSEEMLRAIGEAAAVHEGERTFMAVYMSSTGRPSDMSGGNLRIPVYPFPEQAAAALAQVVQYAEWCEKPEGDLVTFDDVDRGAAEAVLDAVLARTGDEPGWMEPAEVERVLQAYGMRVPGSGTATSEDEAVAIAAGFAGPAVLKVVAPSAVHKSDVGGIVLGVEGEDAVRQAYRHVTSVVDDAEGALVQEFIPGGHEILIGMTTDPNFGPLIVFGLGGVFVELIGDVAFRIQPLTDLDAREMISEVKSSRLLEGFRGGPAGDVDAVVETLLRVSALVEDYPEILEMDLNPVKVAAPGDGVTVVDARIRVRRVDRAPVPEVQLKPIPV